MMNAECITIICNSYVLIVTLHSIFELSGLLYKYNILGVCIKHCTVQILIHVYIFNVMQVVMFMFHYNKHAHSGMKPTNQLASASHCSKFSVMYNDLPQYTDLMSAL